MLKRFNVKNFLSFDKREDKTSEEFSMIPGKVRNKSNHILEDGDIKLLQFSALFGANASGKSNFVKALACMRRIIMRDSTKGFWDSYCRIHKENESNTTYFSVEICLKGKIYSYGFEVILQKSEFVSEWLYELRENGDDRLIFDRDIPNSTIQWNPDWKKNAELWRRISDYTEEMKSDNQGLLLNYMNHKKSAFYKTFASDSNVSVFKDVYYWFWNSLDITFPTDPVGYATFVNAEGLETASKIVSSFGTGVTSYKTLYISLEDLYQKLPEEIARHLKDQIDKAKEILITERKKNSQINITANLSGNLYMITIDSSTKIECNEIRFVHYNDESITYSFGEESDGTQRLWELMEILLSDENKTFVIDEIDRCMHPCLTYKFVDTFFKYVKKKKKQLIVTTHESRLLDFDLLRRDEIWFVNKRSSGESDLYSLEEYNTRFDQKIDKAYLEGRYGGVPIFTSIFPVNNDKVNEGGKR